jgi:hypothetical protein
MLEWLSSNQKVIYILINYRQIFLQYHWGQGYDHVVLLLALIKLDYNLSTISDKWGNHLPCQPTLAAQLLENWLVQVNYKTPWYTL